MEYTVVGVWKGDEPLVAGVIEGRHDVVGGDQESFPEGVWATYVDAEDVTTAETVAQAAMKDTDT